MNLQRFLGLVAAAAVLGAGIALALPVGLHAVDRVGQPIGCGTGFLPDFDTATELDGLNRAQHLAGGPAFALSDYRAQCAAVIDRRRATALVVAVTGAFIGLSALLARRSEHSRATEPAGDQAHHTWMGAQGFADEIGARPTQPILKEAVRQQIRRHHHAAAG